MTLPNYHDGSIVNLMSTIVKAMGGKTHHHPLKILPPGEIGNSKNIVLIVIDGLGYNLLSKHGTGTTLMNHLHGKMTSVFPTTTAAAITSYKTGLEPAEHGLVSWYIYLKELGFIAVPLRFTVRGGKAINDELAKHMFDSKNVFDKVKARPFVVAPDILVDSTYTASYSGRAKRIPFNNLAGMARAIIKIVKHGSKRKYIYAYWHMLDSISHKRGPESRKTIAELKRVDAAFSLLIKKLEGTGTTVILSADHGQTTIPPTRRILLNDYPDIMECLVVPLSGDAREAFAYVRAGREKKFETLMRKHLGHACDVYKSEEFASQGYFGTGKSHKRFLDRIGDYVIISKDGYALIDELPGCKPKKVIGYHSGMSEDEMYVPVIVAKC